MLLVIGIIVGLPSLGETLFFSWDPTFQAPALRYGPTHTNYHAFREFTLTIGALAVMLWAMFQAEHDRTPALWATMALAAVFYYGGWWLPWPLLGLHTPNLVSELVHEAAAFISCSAIALAWRCFRPAQRRDHDRPGGPVGQTPTSQLSGGNSGHRTSA